MPPKDRRNAEIQVEETSIRCRHLPIYQRVFFDLWSAECGPKSLARQVSNYLQMRSSRRHCNCPINWFLTVVRYRKHRSDAEFWFWHPISNIVSAKITPPWNVNRCAFAVSNTVNWSFLEVGSIIGWRKSNGASACSKRLSIGRNDISPWLRFKETMVLHHSIGNRLGYLSTTLGLLKNPSMLTVLTLPISEISLHDRQVELLTPIHITPIWATWAALIRPLLILRPTTL